MTPPRRPRPAPPPDPDPEQPPATPLRYANWAAVVGLVSNVAALALAVAAVATDIARYDIAEPLYGAFLYAALPVALVSAVLCLVWRRRMASRYRASAIAALVTAAIGLASTPVFAVFQVFSLMRDF